MLKFGKHVEMTANIAIILVAMLIGIVLVRNYLLIPTNKAQDAVRFPFSRPELAGTKLAIDGIKWEEKAQTLVFALKKDCRFCTESGSFYQRIANNEKVRSKTHLLAVFPHSIEEGKQYLSELNVPIDDLKQMALASIKVTGTPMLILVDSQGVITDSWIGKLPPETENEIFAKLQ